ncbi:MAG: hypothetical protein RL021_286, partial [Bacteroidota bacterium]
MKNSLFTVLLLTGFLSVFGQNPPIWTNRFATAGDNSDKYNSIAPLSGGFVTAGYSVKQGNYRDFLTVRTDGSGNILWSRTKNGVGNGNDVADFVAVDASNNIYVAGYTDGGNSQDDICLLKYDSNGNLLWTTIWNNTSSAQDDIPLDMALDASGNIIICGSTEPDALAGSSDYVTLKFAPNGGLLWQAIYARPGVAGGRDEADALVIDAAGDVYVTGRSFNGADDDIVTLKYNGASGALAWGTPAVYNSGTGDDRGADIALNSNGTSVYVTGRTDNGNDDDVRIVKYNSSGLFQWTRFYNGTLQQNDRGLFVYVDAAENIYVGGQTDADFSALTNYDFLLLKYSSLGAITWFRSDGFAALQNDIPTSMTVDAAGNLILTGYSDFDPGLTTSNYFYAVVWNNAGTKLSSSFNTGTLPNGNSEATEAVVNPTNGNIIVAGVFENTVSQKDGGIWSITTSGVTNWSRSHNFFGDFTSAFEAVTATSSSQAVAVGYSYVEGNERDALIRLVTNSGQFLCDRLFNGTNDADDELVDAVTDANGLIYAVGYTKGAGQKSNYL